MIFTSDNPRSEDPAQIIKDMEEGVDPAFKRHTMSIVDRREAIKIYKDPRAHKSSRYKTLEGCAGMARSGRTTDAPSVPKDHTAQAVDPPPFLATICQKYIVPPASVGVVYQKSVVFATTIGGGFDVPK